MVRLTVRLRLRLRLRVRVRVRLELAATDRQPKARTRLRTHRTRLVGLEGRGGHAARQRLLRLHLVRAATEVVAVAVARAVVWRGKRGEEVAG
jgi:hypothetical protein